MEVEVQGEVHTEELEQGLLDKVKKYCLLNQEETLSEDVMKKVVKCLLQGNPDDLGGLTALRGFVYQYYVAIHYMVEMLYEENAWWTEVVFEYLDDVALLGNDKIRFVQVKTVREDGQDRHLIPSKLSKRESGLDSWLDTLFLNLPHFENRQKYIGKHDSTPKEFCVQFEIATNAPYDNKSLKLYAENTSYQLLEGAIPPEESLKNSLLKVYKKPIKEEGKSVRHQDIYFNHSVKQGAEWCLERFYLNHLGFMDNLKDKIIGRISDYCKINQTFHNESIKGKLSSTKFFPGDGLLYDYVARKIFNKLLFCIIQRTHRDDLPYKHLLVFNKNEVKDWVVDWKQGAFLEIQRDIEHTVQREQFSNCFQELKEEITTSWNTVIRDDLMGALTWIYDALEREAANGNPYVYEQFLNRLFHLNNSNLPSKRTLKDTNYLQESLKYMMVCLAFYPERNFLFSNAQLLFKQGKQGEEAWNIFTLYCAREKETYAQALRRIIDRSKDCLFTQSLKHTYYCFVTHEEKKSLVSEWSNPFSTLIPITHNHEDSEIDIVKQSENIKFKKVEILDNVVTLFNSSTNKGSFRDETYRAAWHELLNQNM
ncbi:dsDNA nuclease domain-containing protein [Paenibacillus illinoisensis]|uniref:dsDNA nuclease domain-containing protein n=1 Tax=Paenibacillus illinoisensis TaxID=59845 RepID=UPI001C8EBF3B|nr:dsDNA nuclease domain-containing protein [Paenibacillus illinoisensis]MBY0217844.1 DUF4297 domain-containing protein [Paenibacillus illinoisensis]